MTPTRRRPAADRRPQQGLAGRARRRDAPRGRLPAAPRPTRAVARTTPRTTSSSSSCARATSRSTSARARSTSASPAATCCSTRGATAEEVLPLGFGALDVPVRRPGRARRPTSPDLGRPADRHVVRRAWSQATSRSAASTPTSIRLDGAVETAVRLGVADVDRRRRRDRARTLRAGRPGDLRRADPASPRRCWSRRAGARRTPAVEQLVRRLAGRPRRPHAT